MGDFECGMVFCLIIVAVFGFGVFLGGAFITDECEDLGRFNLGDAVFECTQIELK